jgi:hypothetical protein
VKLANEDWPDILKLPGAELYVYRLMNQEGHPVGKWGPSVAFTLSMARRSNFNSLVEQGAAYWIRCGTLLYSVE